MDSIYTIAFFVCAVLFVFNLVERKLITKETVEMKKLVKKWDFIGKKPKADIIH